MMYDPVCGVRNQFEASAVGWSGRLNAEHPYQMKFSERKSFVTSSNYFDIC